MSRAKPIELNTITFSKQGDATAFFKTMLSRYNDRDRINEEDSSILFDLIQRHPDGKIGIGIDYFYKDLSPDYPNSCFHIMRLDGTTTDFSYPSCIRGVKPSLQTYYYRACRFAVSHYLTEDKNKLFASGPVHCSQSGELVTKESSQYRHTQPTFTSLIESFKEEQDLTISQDLFTSDRDMQYSIRFIDTSIAEAFIAYHKQHSNLSVFKT